MLEIPALLWERSKHGGKLRLRESLKYRRKQQVWQSSRKDRAPWCLRPRLCASAQVLLQGSPRLRGNENKFTLCISSVVLWLFLRPACASSHRRQSQETPLGELPSCTVRSLATHGKCRAVLAAEEVKGTMLLAARECGWLCISGVQLMCLNPGAQTRGDSPMSSLRQVIKSLALVWPWRGEGRLQLQLLLSSVLWPSRAAGALRQRQSMWVCTALARTAGKSRCPATLRTMQIPLALVFTKRRYPHLLRKQGSFGKSTTA